MTIWDEMSDAERKESLRHLGPQGVWAADALDAQAARIAELEGALRDVLTTRKHEARMFNLANTATPSDVTSSVPAKEINEYAKACAASSAAEKRAREALKEKP